MTYSKLLSSGALLLGLVSSCRTHPSGVGPSGSGGGSVSRRTVAVGFGPSIDLSINTIEWRADQLTELRSELAALNRSVLGSYVQFEEVSEGMAQVVVRPFDSGPGCSLGAARYTVGTTFIEIDPACCYGYDSLRTALGHELGHFPLGMGHVPASRGRAMMNPDLSYGMGEELGTDIPSPIPTELDRLEYVSRNHL